MSQLTNLTAILGANLASGDLLLVRDVSVTGDTGKDKSITVAELTAKLGINPTGAWSGATAYIPGDLVTSSGSSYRCKANTTNNVPPNATYWDLLAAKGDTGADGTNGTPLPIQTGNSGKVLSTNGTAASWVVAPGTLFNICRISLNGQRSYYSPASDTDTARGDALRQAIITDGVAYDTFLINGNFFTATQIPLKIGMTVAGYGHGPTNVAIPANGTSHPRSVFLIDGVSHTTIRDLSVSCTHEQVGWGGVGILTSGTCDRVTIENVRASNFDVGFEIGSSSSIEDGVRLIDCSAYYCDYFGCLVNAGCEYNKISNFKATRIKTIYGGIGYGMSNMAGNCPMTELHLDGCDNGIQRGNGSNHAHDTATGGSINHTTYNAVFMDGTQNGFVMTGFAIFGGSVKLNNCEGFRLINGFLDGDIVVDTTPGLSGLNYFQNLNVSLGVTTGVKDDSGANLISSSPANYAKLVIKDCYDRAAHVAWSHNT